MQLQSGSVLVVDDESSLRKALRASLTASGFAVEEARDGEEAIGTVQRHPVDLVLLDMNMPGLAASTPVNGSRASRRNAASWW